MISAGSMTAAPGMPCCAQVGKADVATAVSDDGWTPLMLSARVGAVEKVRALLAAGAEPSAANSQVGADRPDVFSEVGADA
jgi:hypothetical protein